MGKTYIRFIGYLQAIAIILVVLGHSLHLYPDGDNGRSTLAYRLIYSFHMPLFMFVSGFLLTLTTDPSLRQRTSANVRRFISTKISRLMVPYMVLTAVTFVPRSMMSSLADDPVTLNLSNFLGAFYRPELLPIPYFWFLQSAFTLLIAVFLIRWLLSRCKVSEGASDILLISVSAILLASDTDTTIFSLNMSARMCLFLTAGIVYCHHYTSIDSLTISGSKPNEQIAEFLSAHPEAFRGLYPSPTSSTTLINSTAANKAITDYVDKEGSTVAAAYLIAVYYTPTLSPSESATLINRFNAADETRSLLASISESVKNELNTAKTARVHSFNLPSYGDSTVKYSPASQSYTLMAFTSADTGAKRKEITSRLRELASSHSHRSLRVIEMSLCADSASWRSVIKRDTLVNWPRILLPGGPAALSVRHLNIGQPPYYILADSTGRQIYRGEALIAAIDSLNSRLK